MPAQLPMLVVPPILALLVTLAVAKAESLKHEAPAACEEMVTLVDNSGGSSGSLWVLPYRHLCPPAMCLRNGGILC